MFEGGKKLGYGKCVWADGNQFEGTWDGSSLNGLGVYTYTNGNRYVGYWVNSKWHGVGVFHFHAGIGSEWYSGEFNNGTAHKVGLCKSWNGDMYL